MIPDCYGMLKVIEQYPRMYIGEDTLQGIHIYVNGYSHALFDKGIDIHGLPRDPFFDWLADKLGYSSTSAGWVNMILGEVLGFDPAKINWDEMLETPVSKEQHLHSIARFYELLEEFKSEMEGKI